MNGEQEGGYIGGLSGNICVREMDWVSKGRKMAK